MGVSSSKENLAYRASNSIKEGSKKPVMESKVDYFEPTFRVAWLIGIEHYTNVKSTAGKVVYTNVTQSKLDIENMKSLVNELRFN